MKTVDEFIKWCAHFPGSKWVHAKGNEDGIMEHNTADALERLKGFTRLVWDGSPLSCASFTGLVPRFLRAKLGRKVVAFINVDTIDVFKRSWEDTAVQFPGSLIVVVVSPELDVDRFQARGDLWRVRSMSADLQNAFCISRIASKLTASKALVSLGINDITRVEIESSSVDAVQWTVFVPAASSNSRPFLDWAASRKSSQLEIVQLDSPGASSASTCRAPPASVPIPTRTASATASRAASSDGTRVTGRPTAVASGSSASRARSEVRPCATSAVPVDRAGRDVVRGRLEQLPGKASTAGGRAPPSSIIVKSVDEFVRWNSHFQTARWAHVKGFGDGMSDRYNPDALARLSSYSRLVWDGSPLSTTSFTSIIPRYLRAKSGRKAVAFVKLDEVDSFKSSWSTIAAEFPSGVMVVATDIDSDAERFSVKTELWRVRRFKKDVHDSYILGRIAMSLTAARLVVCLGGVLSISQEAEASLPDGVQWTIYALSRGTKERDPSLVEWAASKKHSQLELIEGKDESEANALSKEGPVSVSALAASADGGSSARQQATANGACPSATESADGSSSLAASSGFPSAVSVSNSNGQMLAVSPRTRDPATCASTVGSNGQTVPASGSGESILGTSIGQESTPQQRTSRSVSPAAAARHATPPEGEGSGSAPRQGSSRQGSSARSASRSCLRTSSNGDTQEKMRSPSTGYRVTFADANDESPVSRRLLR